MVWFITGTSTGIGYTLAQRAAEAGHTVVATARNTDSLHGLAAQFGDRFLAVRHDVNHAADNEAAVQTALERFGRIDVLVNNAGYGLEGPLEEIALTQVRAQLETNFFGLVHLCQLVTPHMRAQGSGYIFNVASIAGLRGYQGLSVYNASKFAVVGLSEALRGELKPFGIRVSIVEPGPYRTDWAGRSLQRAPAMDDTAASSTSPYAALHRTLFQGIDGNSGKQSGDPAQIADVLISAATAPPDREVPLHMVFGDEAIKVCNDKLKRYQEPDFLDVFPHTRRAL